VLAFEFSLGLGVKFRFLIPVPMPSLAVRTLVREEEQESQGRNVTNQSLPCRRARETSYFQDSYQKRVLETYVCVRSDLDDPWLAGLLAFWDEG
jgi:hypothetical protein